MASGSTGKSRAKTAQRPGALANSPRVTASVAPSARSMMSTMAYLFGETDAVIDIRVENVDHEVDDHDHDPSLHHDPLHERKIALEDALVSHTADTGPSKGQIE